MSYIGRIGAARIDTASSLGIDRAEQMAKEGYDPLVIKIQTGWEMGIDGFWRYELSDPFLETAAIESFVKPRFGEPISIRLVMRDTGMLDAYPEFTDLTLFAMYSPQKGTAGYYNPDTKGMVISMGSSSDKFEYQIDGVLLHEFQHLIQQVEGFAKGGSPKRIGMRRYLRLAGEVEARNIPLRHFMSEEERRRTLRTATQDVPDDCQIIVF